MLIRLVSDIHLDFDIQVGKGMNAAWTPPVMERDAETILVIAGDVWYENRFYTRRFNDGRTWLEHVAPRFAHVVLVKGNHDYWGLDFTTALRDARMLLSKLAVTNVHLLEDEIVIFDDVKILGSTLWTDYNCNNPLLMTLAPHRMNDYSHMKMGGGTVKPFQLYEAHVNSRSFIEDNAIKDYPEQKLVVVTHMLPSYQSIHETYRRNEFNGLYASNMDAYIEQSTIDFWFHGHTHHSFDYKIGGTRVMCNPRGYHLRKAMVNKNENDDFDANLIIEV